MRGLLLNVVKATGAVALSLMAMQARLASPALGTDVEDILVTGQRSDALLRNAASSQTRCCA
ncbi:MAG: hypothetical protein ACO1PZ_01235 [Gammaproteobacteria bacterium]